MNFPRDGGLLVSNDCAEKFLPKGFDFLEQDKRANMLAKSLERVAKAKSMVEDYSVNQDGSLFLRIILHDEMTLQSKYTIYISKFGSMVTVDDGVDVERDVVDVIEKSGYKYVDRKMLDSKYSGGVEFFKGKSWYYRYFAPWFAFS